MYTCCVCINDEIAARTVLQRQPHSVRLHLEQEGLAVVSIAREDPSTLPGDDPFPRARMHRDRNAR